MHGLSVKSVDDTTVTINKTNVRAEMKPFINTQDQHLPS